jgi:predicted transcriptional regulator
MNVFRPDAPGTASVLGPLESAVLNALWEIGSRATVGDVVECLKQAGSSVHYSSAKTTLNTLAAKGYAEKRPLGRANTFSPKISREEFERHVVGGVLSGLMRNYRNPLIANLAQTLANDEQSLKEFERLLEQQRRPKGET